MPRPNQYNRDLVSETSRLEAPAGLPEDVKRLFEHIVDAVDGSHFVPAEGLLLGEYCYALARCARAEAAIAEEGEILGGKPNPWFLILRDARHQVGTLATKLRLATNARTESKQVRSGRAPVHVDFSKLRERHDEP